TNAWRKGSIKLINRSPISRRFQRIDFAPVSDVADGRVRRRLLALLCMSPSEPWLKEVRTRHNKPADFLFSNSTNPSVCVSTIATMERFPLPQELPVFTRPRTVPRVSDLL